MAPRGVDPPTSRVRFSYETLLTPAARAALGVDRA